MRRRLGCLAWRRRTPLRPLSTTPHTQGSSNGTHEETGENYLRVGPEMAARLDGYAEDAVALAHQQLNFDDRAGPVCSDAVLCGYRRPELLTNNLPIAELQYVTRGLLVTAFECESVEYQLSSWDDALRRCLQAHAKPMDTVYVLPEAMGGPGACERQIGPLADYVVHDIPWDWLEKEICVKDFRKACTEHIPRLCIMGSRFYFGNEPLSEMKDVCAHWDCPIIYDGTALAGLFASGHLENPVTGGFADGMIVDTSGSFGGPEGGLIVTNTVDHKYGIASEDRRATPRYEIARTLGLAHAANDLMSPVAFEMFRLAQINAGALTSALNEHGVDAFDGFDAVLVPDIGPDVDLEGAGIRAADAMGGKLFQMRHVTRAGATEGDMQDIAMILARLHRGEEPHILREEVLELTQGWRTQ